MFCESRGGGAPRLTNESSSSCLGLLAEGGHGLAQLEFTKTFLNPGGGHFDEAPHIMYEIMELVQHIFPPPTPLPRSETCIRSDQRPQRPSGIPNLVASEHTHF